MLQPINDPAASSQKIIEDARVLTRINSKLLTLEFIPLSTLCDPIPGTESLRSWKVMMVEDGKSLLQAFATDLLISTRGEGELVLHTTETVDELVERIWSLNPHIVLLDCNLSGGVSGLEVCDKLRKRRDVASAEGKRALGPLADLLALPRLVGFSSSTDPKQPFLNHGADDFLLKTYPRDNLVEVADLWSTYFSRIPPT